MEPTDLNSSSSDDLRLETWLRQTKPELPDAGFSRRVRTALPAKRTARPMPSRLIMSAIGGVIGVAFALKEGVSLSGLTAAATQLNESLVSVSPLVTSPMLLVALAVTGVSLLIAFATGNGARWSNI